MKTIKTITMMIALTVIANIALGTGTGNLKVNILPLTAERAVVSILNNAESKFEITIKSYDGDVLYNKQIKDSNEYTKVYDFSELASGDYKLIVDIDGEIREREFSIDDEKIIVGKVRSIVKPFFTFSDNILRIAYLNYSNNDVKLSIYDAGTLIYDKSYEKTFSVNEGLNLSKLEKGNYLVVLSDDKASYDYTVMVQ